MKLHIIKLVNEGQMLPRFYGVAWPQWHSKSAVCLPVPFNVIAGLLRGAWLFLKYGWMPVPFNPRAAYQKGRDDAFTHLAEKGDGEIHALYLEHAAEELWESIPEAYREKNRQDGYHPYVFLRERAEAVRRGT